MEWGRPYRGFARLWFQRIDIKLMMWCAFLWRISKYMYIYFWFLHRVDGRTVGKWEIQRYYTNIQEQRRGSLINVFGAYRIILLLQVVSGFAFYILWEKCSQRTLLTWL